MSAKEWPVWVAVLTAGVGLFTAGVLYLDGTGTIQYAVPGAGVVTCWVALSRLWTLSA
ncbi:hypothetical protein M0R88_14705 [Halorussus gelatinilyticus]|uniref:Uncharacterized protein n=1 Tax=Halorussus gelatinilyticus TaxID=2937524 RepID=A0A8U0IFU8_9EURY|nr:hypothetical protein [Halorussus gelatinilyticus]UPV99757.1 hypothetical protein M0R88_14705 [Halorussus gelatinilyticus]